MAPSSTLDGVVQDPTGEEGFRHGGWFLQAGSNDREGFYQAALDEALGAEALLQGRRTHEFLAARWPSRSGELADRLNTMPKYVVSSTLEASDWNNSTVLRGDVVSEVSRLRQELNGEIVVAGSIHLVRTLIEHDLIDELRLLVYPFVLGPASAYSARPATRCRCASSPAGPSVTASHTSPTRSSEPPSRACRRSRWPPSAVQTDP